MQCWTNKQPFALSVNRRKQAIQFWNISLLILKFLLFFCLCLWGLAFHRHLYVHRSWSRDEMKQERCSTKSNRGQFDRLIHVHLCWLDPTEVCPPSFPSSSSSRCRRWSAGPRASVPKGHLLLECKRITLPVAKQCWNSLIVLRSFCFNSSSQILVQKIGWESPRFQPRCAASS